MNSNENVGNNANSPMHLGMTGPPGGVNPFTVDEIQELMGLIPSEQQSNAPPTSASHNSLEDLHSPMHVNAVAVSNTSSSGLASVLGGSRRGPSSATTSSGSRGHKTSSNEIDDGSKNQARSERKRSREKQRRTDVNKQFGELTEVLKRIEAEEQQLQQERAAREEAREGGPKPNSHQSSRMVLPPFSPTNRVDLIARTIAHLERLSHVTKKQVQELQSLEDQLKTAQKAGEDTAQKLKEAVFNQQQQGGMMMMNGMTGGNPMFNPMQMAMGNPMGMAPGAANAATNGMMSIQPQKQQMMMMVPMMMPPGGANAGAPGTPMMPTGNQPFMMMPQAFMPSQQPQQVAPAPGSASTNASNTPASSNPAPAPVGNPAPAPAVSQQQQQLQNQQAMVMQQAMMMQSMQPMMQQMQMMQQQQQAMQPQPQVIYPAPTQAPQPAPMMAAPMPASTTAGMAASQQHQQPQQRSSPVASAASSGSSNGTVGSQPQDSAKGQQQGSGGGGSYAYAA